MTGESIIDVQELVDKAGDAEGREMLRVLLSEVLQAVLEAERDEHVGVGRYERSDERRDTRSGYKPRTISTLVGDLELQRPQTRGGMQSRILEHYSRIDQSVLTMAAEMYAHGVTTRKVEALLERTIGVDVSAATVSEANKQLDEGLEATKDRPLGEISALWVDARFDKVRREGAVRSTALLTAVGIDKEGHRRVLDFMAVEGETEHAWRELFKRLKERGMTGVRFAVSDDHPGLRDALLETFPGIVWQRCQAHVIRNILDRTPKAHREQIKTLLQDVFDAPDEQRARQRLRQLAELAEQHKDGLGDYIEETAEESLAVFAVPRSMRVRLRSTNMLERLLQEVKRRTKVSRIFPSMSSYERCSGVILQHADEKWQAAGRRYLDADELLEALDADTEQDDELPEAAE